MMPTPSQTLQRPTHDEIAVAIHPIIAAEITIRSRVINGTEEKVLSVLDTVGLNVFGSRSCFFGDSEMVLIVVSDASPARQALEAAGFECQKIASVVAVPMPTADVKAAVLASLMNAGIGLLYCYSLCPASSDDCLILRTADDELALRVIEGGRWAQAA